MRGLVEEAARDQVSDIHIEPEADELRIRVRIDGILHERSVHGRDQHAPIVSRIKVMADLDIAESRKPQGRALRHEPARRRHRRAGLDLPTVTARAPSCGSCGRQPADRLHDLGMQPEVLRRLEECLDQPHGMVLVTGPTGSGKTTTLYAALARLSTTERNVVTVEDPVEKRVRLLRQTEVNPKAGLTFAGGLRSILRQDPDIIMVGEIRDRETARSASRLRSRGTWC